MRLQISLAGIFVFLLCFNSYAGVFSQTDLMAASESGDLDKVKVLLAAGADVNATNDHRMTALIFAAMKGHVDVVKALLVKGARVSIEDYYGATALLHAFYLHHQDVTRLLAPQAIADATTDIETNPKYEKFYYNRAVAYYVMKDYDKAWQDVSKAQSLGLDVDSRFLEWLKKDSGRDK